MCTPQSQFGNNADPTAEMVEDERRCIFCYKQEVGSGPLACFHLHEPSQRSPDAYPEMLMEQLAPIYILREILGVSREVLVEFLQSIGSPSSWDILVCQGCSRRVAETVKLRAKIRRLEKRLGQVKQELIQSVKTTTSVDRHKSLVASFDTASVRDKARLMVYAGAFVVEDGNDSPAMYTSEGLIIESQSLFDSPCPSNDGSVKKEPDSSFEDGGIADVGDVFEVELTDELQTLLPKHKQEESTTLEEDDPKKRVNSRRKSTRLNPSAVEKGQDEDAFEDWKRCQGDVEFRSRRGLRKIIPSTAFASVYYRNNKRPASPDFRPSDSNEGTDDDNDQDSCSDNSRTSKRRAKAVARKRPNGRNVKCPSCTYVSNCNVSIANHFNFRHSVTIKHKKHELCGECDLLFKNLSAVDIHKKFTHSSEVYKCEKCIRIFKNEKALRKHKGRNTVKVFCGICTMKLCNAGALKLHEKVSHPDVVTERVQEKAKEKKPEPSCMCEECGKILKNRVTYQIHLKMHKRVAVTEQVPKPSFQCTVCEQNFVRKNILKIHQCRFHAQELNLNPVSCSFCLRKYPDDKVLSEHVQNIHEQTKKFICDLCGQRFFKESVLKQHQLKHGDPKYKCQQCNLPFYKKQDLKTHNLLKHLPYEERPHRCNICQKRFTSSTKLYIHRKIHEGNGSKPYQCSICGKTFGQRNYLYCHMRYKHERQPRGVKKSNTETIQPEVIMETETN